mgnify:CR=1 FL=1
MNRLDDHSKKYTGLDEVILEKDNMQIMVIIFHENLCILEVENKMKKDIERKFKVRLLLMKHIVK